MASVDFSPNISSQVDVGKSTVKASTIKAALLELFESNPKLKSYLVNDDGTLRKHVAIVVDGVPVKDRANQSDSISEKSEIFIMQALSGG